MNTLIGLRPPLPASATPAPPVAPTYIVAASREEPFPAARAHLKPLTFTEAQAMVAAWRADGWANADMAPRMPR